MFEFSDHFNELLDGKDLVGGASSSGKTCLLCATPITEDRTDSIEKNHREQFAGDGWWCDAMMVSAHFLGALVFFRK